VKMRGRPDFLLLFLVLLLVGFGITMVLSASSIFAYSYEFTNKGCDYCNGDYLYFVKRQFMWAVLGFIGMLVTMNIPYSFYQKHFIKIAVISLLLLIVIWIPGVGDDVKGAHSRINLGSAKIQTSEFAKLGLILYLSALIAKKGENFRDFKKGLFPALVVTGVFFLLIFIQPDLGTAAILLGSAGTIMLCGGARIKHLFMLVIPAGFFVGIYILTKEHAMARIQSFLNPWGDALGTNWQLQQSLYALARGSLTGAGFGKSLQKYLYLPEAHNDFIFSIIAEELGFLGTSLFLFVYVLFLLRGVYIALKSKDPFASLTGIGIVSMIGIQAFINLGGVTGTIPITGVPLPFISYGGSSLLICMISTGILLSLSREVNRQKALELMKTGS